MLPRISLFVLLFCLTATPVAAPQRVVSLNLCADELLLALANPQQVVSVSWLSHDPAMTFDAPTAQQYRANRGGLEEIIGLEPDLVVVGRYTTVLTQQMLEEMGVPMVQLDLPTNLASAYQQITRVGGALGQEQRAQALITNLKTAASRARRHGKSAVVYYPNGFTTGSDSLIDSVLSEVGLVNIGAEQGASAFSPLSLERLILARPDYLIVEATSSPLPSLADQLLAHPALSAQFPQRVEIPTQAWSCGTGHLLRAFALLDGLG